MGIYSWGRVTEAYITLLQQYYFKQNNSHFTTVPTESLSPATSFPVLLLRARHVKTAQTALHRSGPETICKGCQGTKIIDS